MDFPGYALGGFSVGEPTEQMLTALAPTTALLPADKPRYLMGVGRPRGHLAGGGPRHRHVRLRAADAQWPQRLCLHQFGHSAAAKCLPSQRPGPHRGGLCQCPVCRQFSRAYLHHLFHAGEMLGPTLLSWHNLAYYNHLLAEIRSAIAEGRWTRVFASQPCPLGHNNLRYWARRLLAGTRTSC